MSKPLITGPLFKWFGSKWLSAKTLPEPKHEVIIEPFGGSAGYSLRYPERSVVICESNGHIYALWCWLTSLASERDIREIPVNVPEGTDILTLGLSRGQALLLKSWQRTNTTGDCWTISPWGNKPGQWTENTRARVASEFRAIRHWVVYDDGLPILRTWIREATWFVDPPYQYNYQYGGRPIDYQELAQMILSRKGQKIVCEAEDPTMGYVPTWLPFEYWGTRITSRRKTENHHHSKELLWTSDA